eukprot:Blabericola_migrator_1__1209@NODE_130_length_13282_cov_126_272191_g115_i0_p1_GENE_NODE_130_length_13282_cov_126_272191_g115_i0NODE_130_length_13282_cov_126_272191_g115_i0_p1_ORF_typecomplete_len2458_score395_97Nucleoporin_N/PF08801_11/0_00017KAP/PF05804_12/1_8e03KAP/PF05804_12/0_13_NODE_130_length_13282_cov_126_272191_g115_i021349507
MFLPPLSNGVGGEGSGTARESTASFIPITARGSTYQQSRLLSPSPHISPLRKPVGRPTLSRPSTNLILPVNGDTTTSRPSVRRRRLVQQQQQVPTVADFSSQYSADVRDKLCRFMNSVDIFPIAPQSIITEDSVYRHVDDLVTPSRVSNLPTHIEDELSASCISKAEGRLPTIGVTTDYCSTWWLKDSSILLWHWVTPNDVYEISVGAPVLSVCFSDCAFGETLARCFPEAPEIQVIQSMREQWQANIRLNTLQDGERSQIMFSTAVVLTTSFLLKLVLCGSDKLGVLDHVPLMYSKTPVDGLSIVCMTNFRRSGSCYLSDRNGGLYEYQCDFIKSAYVRLNLVQGGRLESLDHQSDSSLFSRIAGWDRRNNIQHTGVLKKLLDVRSVVDRINFSQPPYIKQISADQETGRLYLLCSTSDIYVANLQPYLVTIDTSKGMSFLRIVERETVVKKDAVLSHESLINSILEFTENANWKTQLGRSPASNRMRGSSRGTDGYRGAIRHELKNISVVSVHVVATDAIVLVLSDGSRCYITATPKGKNWNSQISLVGQGSSFGSLGRGLGPGTTTGGLQVCNRLFARSSDTRIWALLQETPHVKPIFEVNLVFNLTSLKIPPPGLSECSVIRKLLEGADDLAFTRKIGSPGVGMSRDTGSLMSVVRSYYSHRCGGFLLCEVRNATDIEGGSRLVAMVPGPCDDRGRTSVEYFQWIYVSEATDTNTPGPLKAAHHRRNAVFDLYSCCDLPLAPSFSHFEEGFDYNSLIFSLSRRLSLATAFALVSSAARRDPSPMDMSGLSVLADALYAGTPLERLEWGSSSLMLPGPCFLSLMRSLQPALPVGLISLSRTRQAAGLKSSLSTLERFVNSLLSELSLIVRVPAVTGVVAEAPESAVRLLQSQIGQQLPALMKWAHLASDHPQSQRPGSDEIGDTQTLFFPDYRDTSLDQLWHILISEFRQSAPVSIEPTSAPDETTPSRGGDGSRQLMLTSLKPISGANRIVTRATFVVPPSPAEPLVPSMATTVGRKPTNSADIAAKLVVLIPLLSGFCDTRGKMITSESSRVQCILRVVSRILQPFSSAPMFTLEAGLPTDVVALGKQPTLVTAPPPIPIKNEFLDAVSSPEPDSSPIMRHGRKRYLQMDTSADVMMAKTRRVGIESMPGTVNPRSAIEAVSQGENLVPADLKLVPRFTVDELEEGKANCEALLRAIQFYEKILMFSVPQEIRNKISDDIARMHEVSLYLNFAKQMFAFFICVTHELTRAPRDVTLDQDGELKLLDAPVFDRLAVASFNDLLCEVFRSSSTESSTLHRWLLCPLSGGIVHLVPPADLLQNASQLFGHHFLLWQSSLEPLRCLAVLLDKFAVERRSILHEQLFELSRREPERLSAIRHKRPLQRDQTSKTDSSDGGPSLDIVAMLEFLWADWTSKAAPSVLRDLKACLPLPNFLESPNQHLNLISVRQRGDDGLEESKKDLRDHILTALICLASLSQSRLIEFNAIETLLELLFEIHAYDAFAVALAMWNHHLQKPSATWRAGWSGPGSTSQESETPALHPQCSQLLQQFLTRLLEVSKHTDDWLGRDVADMVILQLSRRPLPSLTTLWQMLSSSNNTKSSSPSLILINTDGAAVSSFVASFDNSRRFLEESIANETFLWIVSQGDGGNFPRPLAGLNSPHLPKWLDRICMSTSCVPVAEVPAAANLPSLGRRPLNVSNVALAVCEYMFTHGEATRAIEYSLKLLQESPKWLTFPLTVSRLIELSTDLAASGGTPETPPTDVIEQSIDVFFPTQTLSVTRHIVEPDLAQDFRCLFNQRWMQGIEEDWDAVKKWLACLRRIGTLPIDTKLKLLEKVKASNAAEASARRDFAASSQRPMEIREIHQRAKLQLNLLTELLEFTCLLVAIDSAFATLIIEVMLDCNSVSKEKKYGMASEPTRQTLLNNIITFFVSVLHTLMPSQYAIGEAIIDFMTCLKGFAPFPASSLLECWQSITNEESRNRLVRKAPFRRAYNEEGMTASNIVTFVSIATTLKSRNIFVRRTRSLGYLEDSALRFWNIFADASFVDAGIPKLNAKWLSQASSPSSATEGNPLMPIALYLILDRVLRCNYTGKYAQRNSVIIDDCLGAYFSNPASSHTERLRCSEFGGTYFMRVMPVEEGDSPFTSVVSSALMDEQCEVVGLLSCFSLDIGLRSWLWELVGLLRDPVTGERYTPVNSKDLVNRDPTITIANLRAIFDWIYHSIVALEYVVGKLLAPEGGEPRHAMLADVNVAAFHSQLAALIKWLDVELPVNTERHSVQHLTLVEATHALGVCLHDLHVLIVWAASVFLPESAKRLASSHMILLSEVSTGDTSRNSPISNTNLRNEDKGGSLDAAADLEVKKKGWAELARLLVTWGQKARILTTKTVIKEVLASERQQTGWSGSSTKLLQALSSRVNRKSSMIEREVIPALVAYISNQSNYTSPSPLMMVSAFAT